jgi:hypothetical protein
MIKFFIPGMSIHSQYLKVLIIRVCNMLGKASYKWREILLAQIPFEKIYRMLENITPLAEDCGGLCGSKCCTEWESGVGVYLLPGEEQFFRGSDWCEVVEIPPEEQPFPGADAYLLRCRGVCPRSQRPLLCRTFPLAATWEDNGIKIVFDDDGLLICPLVRQGEMEQLNPEFIKRVEAVWKELAIIGPIRSYIEKYTARLESERNQPWRKLLL